MYDRSLLLLLLPFLVLACGGRKDVDRDGNIRLRGEKPVSLEGRRTGDLLQRGIASWYGHPYHGRQTSNGERYDMDAMTAAHKTLPFNTYVRVVNLNNGKETVVRINDRGPFIRGRVIDLSRGAARAVHMIGTGTAEVKLYLVDGPSHDNRRDDHRADKPRASSAERDAWTIQVGSYSTRDRAEAVRTRLKSYGHTIAIVKHRGMFRVRVGRLADRDEADELAANIEFDHRDLETWVLRAD